MSSMPIRTAWSKDFPDVVVDQPLGAVTASPLYHAAKAGDIASAYSLAHELVSNEAVEKLKPLIEGKNAIIVPVHAEEALGTNQIPNATAVVGAYALTGKQYSRQLALSNETLPQLRHGYGEIEAWWTAEFGYDFSFLTEWEARYILNSGKSPDAVRDRIAAAKQMRSHKTDDGD